MDLPRPRPGPDAGISAIAYFGIALALIRLALVYIALRGDAA